MPNNPYSFNVIPCHSGFSSMALRIAPIPAILPHMKALGIAIFWFAAVGSLAQTGVWTPEIDNTLVNVVQRCLASHEKLAVRDSSLALPRANQAAMKVSF